MKCTRSITMTKRRNIVAIVTSAVLLLGLSGILYYFNNYSKKYNTPSFETEYLEGKVEVDERFGYSEMQFSNEYKVGTCGAPYANSNGVDIYFCNPEDNKVLLKCLLLDNEGNTIGECGVIRPNCYVKTIKFNEPKPSGDYELTMKVLGFEPETYYSKGVVNLKTNIKIE